MNDQGFKRYGLAWVPDKQAFYVTDRGTLRITKFSKKGDLLATTHHDLMRSPDFDQKGNIYYMKRLGRDANYRHQLRQYSLDTAADQPIFSAKMQPIATPMIWHGRLVFAPGPHFVAVCHTSSDRIYILDRDSGEVLQRWSAKLPRTQIDVAWRKAYMRDFMARISSKGRPPQGFQIDQRDEWPYLQTMFIDHKDRIWVFLFPAGGKQVTPYKVYDRQGKRLGEGQCRGQPQTLSKPYLYTLQARETGTFLVRYHQQDLLP